MKKEDIASVRAVESGRIGKPTFIRYSLSMNRPEQLNEELLLSEVFNWMSSIDNLELKQLSATRSQNKEVLLITMQLVNATIANLFLDFSRKNVGYAKEFEIAGTKGIYVFDSTHNQGFESDCCQVEEYTIETNTYEHNDLLQLIQKSLEEQSVVNQGGEQK